MSMKKSLPFPAFLLAFFLISLAARGQTPLATDQYLAGSRLFVFTASGLTLRSTPDIKGAALQVIPYGGMVEVLADPAGPVAFTTGNIAGRWTKLKFEENIGYAFDGYLSRLPLNADKVRMEDYLRAVFKVESTVTVPPEKSILDYEKTLFENGIVYETKMYEGGGSTSVMFPERITSFKEVFLLAKISYPVYFAEKRKCSFNPESIRCNHQDGLATLKIEKRGTSYIILENLAD